MRILIMAFLLSLSIESVAIPTKKFTNARKLFKKEKEKMRANVIPATVLLIPSLFLTKEWHLYRECKKTLEYLEAAHTLKRNEKSGSLKYKKAFSDRERRNAKKKIDDLLQKLKEASKEELLKLENKEESNEFKLLSKTKDMQEEELVKLLNRADLLIPKVLGNSETGYARADIDNLIYCMINLDHKDSTVSIFEASLNEEEKLLLQK